jgi:hypothetical protein
MAWTNIAEQIGLDPEQTPIFVFQRSESGEANQKIFEETQALADQPLTRETLAGLGLPLELTDETPLTITTISPDDPGAMQPPFRDIYIAISHGPNGPGASHGPNGPGASHGPNGLGPPTTVMHCHHRHP